MKDEREILDIIANELSQSDGGSENGFILSNMKDALSYYMGAPNGREVEGRSSVVSTDVADAIEWIMPQIMDQFTKNNEIVTFDPLGPEDENQAALETNITYDILMKENPGFIILHHLVKDALMQKNGLTKTYYEQMDQTTTQRYTGLTQFGLQAIASDEKNEIIERTEYVEGGVQFFDVKVKRTEVVKKIRVESVPPEEFRINKQHNSVDPTKARFCSHVVLKTASDLIKSGIPKEVVDDIPRGEMDENRSYRFSSQGEDYLPYGDVSVDPSQDQIEVAECYLHIDLDGDGVSEFMKIEVAGGDNPTHILRMEEMDEEDHPFGAAAAILMSHKFYGMSIYDRLKQLQDQKTTLLRNILDNLYLQNNQRTAVVEGQVNLDDLLISRPGGIVRQRQPGMIEPMITPAVGQDAYNMLEYLDQVRAGRAGVTPEGPMQVENIGDRVGSEGIEKLMSAKEAIVGLIIRVIAETGVKPLMCKIRRLASKHIDAVQNYKFKGEWIQYNPHVWPMRPSTTVRVGTGSGNNKEQLMALSQIIQGQMMLKQDPTQTLVGDQQIYNSWRTYCNISGLQGGNHYFLDPSSPQGQQATSQISQMQQEMKQKQDEMDASMMNMQNKLADAEVGKAQAQMQNVSLKGEIEQLKLQIEQSKAIIEDTQQSKDLQFKYEELIRTLEFKYRELAAKMNIEHEKVESAETKRTGSSGGD
jgi:hypothetical protein